MKTAVKFQNWDFLNGHFNQEQDRWQSLKGAAAQAALNSSPAGNLQQTQLFRLSRKIPMFEDECIPPGTQDVIYGYVFLIFFNLPFCGA